LAICLLPWLLIASKRVGALLGALTVLAAAPTLLLLAFFVSPFLNVDPVVVSLVAAALGGVIGLVLVLRDPTTRRIPPRAILARWLPASIGGLIWLVTIAAARLVPGAAVLGWAMNGDSSHNIQLARALIEYHGITPASGTAVPLANVLLAVAAWPGRGQTSASGLLEHDIIALGTSWSLAIAATGLLLGLVVSSLLEGKRSLVVGLSAGAGSLLVLTFFVTGLPIDSGYLNVHVALPFALATWLVFLKSRESPLITTVLLFAFGFLLLTVWTPLVVLPAALIVVLGVRNWSRMRVAKPRTAITIGAAAVLALAYLVFVSLPSLQGSGEALSTGGHGFPFTGWILLVALAIAVVCGILLRPLEIPALEGIVIIGVAAIAGYAFLLYATFAPSDAWLGYYPTKFLWMMSVVFGAIALSLVLRLAVEKVPKGRARVAGVVIAGAVALVIAGLGPAPTRDHFVVEQPLPRILAGNTWHTGESAVNVILAANRDAGTVVLWNSGNPDEAFINFWVLDYRGAALGESHMARVFTVLAYRDLRDHGSFTPGDPQRLCDLAPELTAPVSVYTQDAGLAAQVSKLCPTAGVKVHTEPPPSQK
jgi:hypothetical protein